MADFMRALPLSWGERPDERDVSSDWREAHADVLERAALVIEGAEVDPETRERLSAALLDSAAPHSIERDIDDAVAIRALAGAVRNARKSPIRSLSRTVTAFLAVARELGVEAELPPRTSGAVALYLAAKAPTPIRAVISGHGLHAIDSGWTFGRGPVLEANANALIEFLAGRSLVAPRPRRRP